MGTKITNQEAWDKALITVARQDKHMVEAVKYFLKLTESDLLKEHWESEDFNAVESHLLLLDLRRCYDRNTKEELHFNGFRFSATRFIGIHCEKFIPCLYNMNNTNEQLFETLKNFKWTRVNAASRRSKDRSNAKRRHINAYKSTKHIGKRDLSKQHDWGTIK